MESRPLISFPVVLIALRQSTCDSQSEHISATHRDAHLVNARALLQRMNEPLCLWAYVLAWLVGLCPTVLDRVPDRD